MKRARHIFKSAAVLGVLVVAVTLSAGHAGAKAAQQQQDGRTAHIANANSASAEANALSRDFADIPLSQRAYMLMPDGLRAEGASGSIVMLSQGNHSLTFYGQDIALTGGAGSAIPLITLIENSITGEGTVEAGKYYKVESDATLIGDILKAVSIVELTGEELEMAKGRVAEWLSLCDGAVIGGVTWAGTNVGEPGRFVGTPDDYGNYYTFDEAQTACPAGWRVPTTEEFAALIDAGQERAEISGVSGRMFGSGDNRVFFPGGGGVVNLSGVYNPNDFGCYWSSTPKRKTAYGLSFNSNTNLIFNNAGMGMTRTNGMSVRCVKDNNE